MCINIVELENLGTIFPSQWKGKTDLKEEVYIRYRWGALNVRVNGKYAFSERIGGELDGIMNDRKLRQALPPEIKLPIQGVPNEQSR